MASPVRPPSVAALPMLLDGAGGHAIFERRKNPDATGADLVDITFLQSGRQTRTATVSLQSMREMVALLRLEARYSPDL